MQTNYARQLHQKLNAAAEDAAYVAYVVQQAQSPIYKSDAQAIQQHLREAFYNYRYIVNAILKSTQRNTEQTAAMH